MARRVPPIPQIHGTKFDDVVNDLIDTANETDLPTFTAIAVAGIGKFLIINHETDAGPAWLRRALDVTGDLRIPDELAHRVDDICKELGRSAKPMVARVVDAAGSWNRFRTRVCSL